MLSGFLFLVKPTTFHFNLSCEITELQLCHFSHFLSLFLGLVTFCHYISKTVIFLTFLTYSHLLCFMTETENTFNHVIFKILLI